jgi:histidine ammonia-lyase
LIKFIAISRKRTPSEIFPSRLFLVSENKTLCHPASVDSLSTSAGTEDHVSMGGFAARKALQVVRNVEKVKQG